MTVGGVKDGVLDLERLWVRVYGDRFRGCGPRERADNFGVTCVGDAGSVERRTVDGRTEPSSLTGGSSLRVLRKVSICDLKELSSSLADACGAMFHASE
jgi:hypothetical protein